MSTNSTIPAETWEAHKATLLDLWKNKNLPLAKLRSEMEQRGFVASKGQYDRQFKKWKVSKNRAGNEWKYISNILTRRSRQGKSSLVFIDNEEVGEAKLRKRIREYEIPRWISPGPTPEPMDGIDVMTPEALLLAITSPPASVLEDELGADLIHVNRKRSLVVPIDLEGLPSLEFMDLLDQKGIW